MSLLNNIKQKRLLVSIASICACVIIILLFKGSVLQQIKDYNICRNAIKLIEHYELDEAERTLLEVSNLRGKALKDYIIFRRALNSVSLLDEVNIDLIKKYRDDCINIILLDENLGNSIENDLKQFVANSDMAIEIYDIYSNNYNTISELYEAIMEEIRLKVSAVNPSFTVAEEKEKIAYWKTLLPKYEEFIDEIDSNYNFELGSGISRLRWILEVAPTEISNLEKDMAEILQTHSEFDSLHYNEDTAQRGRPVGYGNYLSDEPFLKLAEKELWYLLVYKLNKPLEIDNGQTSGGFTYVLFADGTAEITGAAIEATDYIDYMIPENITISGKKYAVKRIGEKAFYDNDYVEKISLPATVTHIAPNAFAKCDSGTEIHINIIPEYIALNAFDDSKFYICCPTEDMKETLRYTFGTGRYSVNEKMVYYGDW